MFIPSKLRIFNFFPKVQKAQLCQNLLDRNGTIFKLNLFIHMIQPPTNFSLLCPTFVEIMIGKDVMTEGRTDDMLERRTENQYLLRGHK